MKTSTLTRLLLANLSVCGLAQVTMAQAPVVRLDQPAPIRLPKDIPSTVASAPEPTPITVVAHSTAATCSSCSAPVVGDATTCTACTAKSKRSLQEKCTYTPQGNLRAKKIPPNSAATHGAVVRGIFARQQQLALAEYFVVYQEDYLENTAELNATGQRHLAGIHKRLSMTEAPIQVEPTGAAVMDGNRRDTAIQALIQLGASNDISTRVIAGTTRAEGLRYEDILIVGYANPLSQSGFGGGGGGGGGFGGVGGSGGGGGGGFGGGIR